MRLVPCIRAACVLPLLLLVAPADAGFFRSEPFPAQRYAGEPRPDAEIARVQLMTRSGPVIVRVNRLGEDRLWDDHRGWTGVTHADVLPGAYVLRFQSSHVIFNRKGEESSEVPALWRGKIDVVLEAGHTYRVRSVADVTDYHELEEATAYVLEDMGPGVPSTCVAVTDLFKEADPDTGLAKSCSQP